MVSAGMNFIKYVLFAFNLLFCIFGITLMGIGIYVQIQMKTYLDFFSTDVNGPAILLIIVGLATLAIAFFGCCGAIKENHCMTLTFAFLIGLVFLCEISAGIAGYVLKAKVNTFVTQEMKAAMLNYDAKGHDGVKNTWDTLQSKQKCCGTTSASDWSSYALQNNGTLPDSCCVGVKPCFLQNTTSATTTTASTITAPKTSISTSQTAKTTSQVSSTTALAPINASDTTTVAPVRRKRDTIRDYYHKPCLDAVEDFVTDNVAYFAGAAVGLAVVEIIGIVIACMLARAINSKYEVA